MTSVPQPASPVVDSRGVVAPVWYRFLADLASKLNSVSTTSTGGGTGTSGTIGADHTVGLTGSPMVYTATVSGFLMISGGGVSAMTWTRTTGVHRPVGSFYAAHPMAVGDTVQITYVGTPSLAFVPF